MARRKPAGPSRFLPYTIGLVLGLTFSFAYACQGPTAPSPKAPASQPQALSPRYLGITATDQDGKLWYVCITQPRPYVSANGLSTTYERDYYIQPQPCPRTPIK